MKEMKVESERIGTGKDLMRREKEKKYEEREITRMKEGKKRKKIIRERKKWR